ncbi:sterol carrier protein domain-containing protein [Haloarculaceae archaeon H-GB11]|nr:sterol carrier protein domain-containing protein [Haloarculaceae archaeon H-GB11]
MTDDWWRRRFDGRSPYCYAYERDGDVVGYVLYTVESDGDEYEMRVWDLSAADSDAERALFWLVATHDSQVQTVRHYRTESALLDRVADPSEFECRLGMGPMVRIPDVPSALEAVPTPERAGEVTVGVTDDLSPWNDGQFGVRTDGETVSCEPVSADTAPDATVDVTTLSQLVVGYHDVERAERVGSLAVSDDATRDALDALFPPQRVALREFF